MKSAINWTELRARVFNRETFKVILAIGIFPPVFGTLQYFAGIDQQELGGDWTPVDGLLNIVYSYLVTTIMVLGTTSLVYGLNMILPWKGNVSKRIFVEVLFILFFSALVQSVILWSLEGTRIIYIRRPLELKDYLQNFIFTATITIIAAAIYEGVFFFRSWRQSLVAAERLEKEHAISQLANLRAQLDPHFMFNSLNVLSSLIRKDPKKAEAFVDDFARVYRYLLEVKNEMVIPLKEELSFVRHYLNLQKLRFDKGLEVEMAIDPQSLGLYLPPLSLQELISNALKHNVVDADHPLHLKIRVHEQYLEICNNVQPRQNPMEGTGTGLQNLRDRYRLLGQEMPRFEIKDQQYRAQLPLLTLEV